jgi:hypothetical protein
LPESIFRKLVAKRYRRIPFAKFGKKIIFKRDLLEKWAEKLILSEPELGNGSTISINPIYYLNREFYCLLNRKRLYYFEI